MKKLRNKKTGETGKSVIISAFDGYDEHYYGSIAELTEEWEDVEPSEPLIKDEKIRKAVKVWAEANNINYNAKDIVFDHAEHRLRWLNVIIEFDVIIGLEHLEDGKTYTIAELCGEENS